MAEVMASGDNFPTRLPQSASFFTSLPLVSAFLAFAIAQFLKVLFTWEKRWDPKRLVGSGGMRSSHSATVTALAVAVGLQDGTGSSSLALAVVLATVLCTFPTGGKYATFHSVPMIDWNLVVMYDASGVRLHAGRQAELLNQIICEIPPEHPLSNSRPLHELLGHTPLQAAAGGALGFMAKGFSAKLISRNKRPNYSVLHFGTLPPGDLPVLVCQPSWSNLPLTSVIYNQLPERSLAKKYVKKELQPRPLFQAARDNALSNALRSMCTSSARGL